MDKQQEITGHYDKSIATDLSNRADSEIIAIRNFNNFIKLALLEMYIKKDFSVLDLGCGKGGDLRKFSRIKISSYTGIDISQNSLNEAKKRFLNMYVPMDACFKCMDAYAGGWRFNRIFDAVSCQFSFHYSCRDLPSLHNTISAISEHVKPGGFFLATIPDTDTLLRRYQKYGNGFGNKFYKVTFKENYDDIVKKTNILGTEYQFILKEAIDDCVEYLIDLKCVTEMFRQFGFEKHLHQGFLSFYGERMPYYKDYIRKKISKRLDNDELKVVELYSVIVFQKNK